MPNIQREYSNKQTANVQQFIDELKAQSVTEKGTFDSVAAEDYVEQASKAAQSKVPEELQAVLDECKDQSDSKRIVNALLDGVTMYEREHGCNVPADIVSQALHNAYGVTEAARTQYRDAMLDSAAAANSLHAENLALQPNRAVISIISAFASAIPWAAYLPADIGSNEARLGILTHRAGERAGMYAAGGVLDGIESGNPLLQASRTHTANPDNNGAVSGKITAFMTDMYHCDQTVDGVKLMRGRTIVYVSGFPVAFEVESSKGSGASAISGNFELAGTAYTMAGSINTDTGVFALTSSPALPASVEVAVEGFIDYERAPELAARIIADVEVFKLFAKPFRAITQQTIDAATQLGNEFGLDPMSESIVAINTQFANERHYDALAKGLRLAQMNTHEFDYTVAAQHQDSSKPEVWRDLVHPLAAASQQMAEDTMNHGISHIYVGKQVLAQLGACAEIFQPSGLTDRPGIYRAGRLFGRFDVYYLPKLIRETATSSQIICVGRGTDVARNPVVLGDAVAPTVLPLLMNTDMRRGSAFYARNFTCVNPHKPSARGFALINVLNMK